jgi:hypothetical protein
MADAPRSGIADRLLLEYVLETRPEVIHKLLENPAAVLDSVGVSEDALTCPPEADAALERSEGLAGRANELGDTPLVDALPRLHEIVRQGLGADFTAAKVPFGIRFSEHLPEVPSTDLTGTGTIECTFGIKCKPDVDG